MKTLPLFLTAGALVLSACQSEPEQPAPVEAPVETPTIQTAMATLSPTEGNTASGQITFTQENGVVRVQGTITGLTPGEHGFHVHENGDCGTGTDGTPAGAAGGHFAPSGSPHGAPNNTADNRHTGDLGNITASSDGTATVNMTDSILSLDGVSNIVGKALLVHANADDLTSQPSGDAGGRVACGIIVMGSGGMMEVNTGDTTTVL